MCTVHYQKMNGSGKTKPSDKRERSGELDQGLFVPGLRFTQAKIGQLTQ